MIQQMEGNVSMHNSKKCGPANLESMHIIFGSAHVTGATAYLHS
jgi:hypothetical protein